MLRFAVVCYTHKKLPYFQDTGGGVGGLTSSFSNKLVFCGRGWSCWAVLGGFGMWWVANVADTEVQFNSTLWHKLFTFHSLTCSVVKYYFNISLF